MVCQVITLCDCENRLMWLMWLMWLMRLMRIDSSQNGRVEIIHCKIINYKSRRKLTLLGSYCIDCSVLHNRPQHIWYAKGVILEAITYCHSQVTYVHHMTTRHVTILHVPN